MYPNLQINLTKLKQNLDAVATLATGRGGCSLMIVTKGLCADPRVVDLLLGDARVAFLADARIENIKTYAAAAQQANKQTVLMRLPMACEIAEVVRHADISFNSELFTLKKLNEEAGKQGKTHKIVLMIDLGDLREGIFYQEEETIFKVVGEILAMEHLDLYGLGANLTCYGAIIPKHDNLSLLVELAAKVEKTFGIQLPLVSGGNSSSVYLIESGGLPEGINNLRLGESFLLGNETAYGAKIPGTCDDGLLLEAQIIELQQKPSLPIGEVGVDAFGQRPVYEDRGVIKRAILALGKQDADPEGMTPLGAGVDILGSSSDHLLLDVTKAETAYKVGDVIGFKLAYSGLLRAVTSPYVKKVYATPGQ